MDTGTMNKLVEDYLPKLFLCGGEKYKQGSVGCYLPCVDLIDQDGHIIISAPNAGDLPTGDEGSKTYLKIVDDDIKVGCVKDSTVYAHFMQTPGQENLYDIQYWLFYCYNGPGTLRIKGKLKVDLEDKLFDEHIHLDVNLITLGAHDGDWEHVTVRVDDNGTCVGVYCSQHSGGEWYSPEQITWDPDGDGKHPYIYPSRDGHANSGNTDPGYTGTPLDLKLKEIGVEVDLTVGLININNGKGKVWSPWTIDGGYTLAAVDGNINDGHIWLQFSGHWGPDYSSDYGKSQIEKRLKDALNDVGYPLGTILDELDLLSEIVNHLKPIMIKDGFPTGPSTPSYKDEWTNGDPGGPTS